jgi:hypothetical protein
VGENVAAEFRLHQSEYAANEADEDNLGSIELLGDDKANSSIPFFDCTHNLNGSVCYADGVGDGHDKCYSEWWYRLTVLATHFFAFLMGVTISIQAVVITRRNRDLKAVTLRPTPN